MEKVIQAKLMKYLNGTIQKLIDNSNGGYNAIINEIPYVLKKGNQSQIMELIYFSKYSHVLKMKVKQIDRKKNLSMYSLIQKNILMNLVNKAENNLYLNIILKDYGGLFDENFYRDYIKNFNPSSNFQDLKDFIKICYLNNQTNIDFNELIITFNKNHIQNNKYSTDFLLSKILKILLKETKIQKETFDIFEHKTLKENDYIPTSSQTQTKLQKYFNTFNIKFIEEYIIEDYISDYYLPEHKILIEYLGPHHFYPLQSQLTQKDKFRHFYLKTVGNKDIIQIPYFEWERLSNDKMVFEYLDKRIKNKEDITNKMMKENFNTFL